RRRAVPFGAGAPAVSPGPRTCPRTGPSACARATWLRQARCGAPPMRRWLSLLLSVMGFAALPGCSVAPWREQPPPWTQGSVADADDVRLVLLDGRELVLTTPRIERGADGPV